MSEPFAWYSQVRVRFAVFKVKIDGGGYIRYTLKDKIDSEGESHDPRLKTKRSDRSRRVIEIRSPELPEGVHADVIVLYEEKRQTAVPLSKLFGKGKGLFATPEEADKFLRNERDQWD